ncbi:MAG: peptidase S10 [Planctomycetota bacterium]
MSTSFAALSLALLAPLAAPQAPAEAPDAGVEGALEDRLSVTEHKIEIAGAEVPYEATAGTLVMRTETGDPKAELFFVAYVRSDVEDRSKRPLMFCFNGGPGSSSVWLHMGVYGPRRVRMTDDGFAPPPPYELVDNDQSLLDVIDLVFIDPVTTGYSRPAEGEAPSQFHGLREDAEWVAEFIRLYTTRNERWESPKFLSGESYGTTRSARLASLLHGRHGLYLNGIVLVSAILNFQTARFDRGNDLPFALFLPTYTATAWYHGRLAPELQESLTDTLAEVERFALGDYTLALMRGDKLPAAERDAIAERLARYTGLSKEYVLGSNLRLNIHRFCKELMRDEDRTVGRLDSRFQGTDYDAVGEGYEFDPSYAAIQGPYTATLNHYLRAELGFESDLPYEILTGRVHPWSFAEAENRYVNVAEDLRQAMTRNPSLKVYVANGYYDLATPYFATHYTFDHLGLDPSLRANVTMGHYESGHMMYIHLPSLAQFRAEVTTFLDNALPE